MPGNPSIDRLDTLDCVERNGVIRQVTRVARVLGMSAYMDYRVLWQGLKKAGVPAFGSNLVDRTSAQTILDTQAFNAVTLVERTAKIADMDKGTVDVTLKYEHLLDGPNQWLQGVLAAGTPKFLFMKGRSSIVQKPTNFFYNKGDTSTPRIQILTGHRYPADDADWKNRKFVAGGDIQLPFPQENETVIGFAWTASPMSYKRQIHNCLNATNWLGKPARSWCCTEAQHEVLDPAGVVVTPPSGILVGTPLYMFTFEFQYNSDTWDETVAYIDSRTGLPPSTVQPATLPDPLNPNVIDQQPDPLAPAISFFPAGYWRVPALPEVDYNTFFAKNFES